MKLKYLLFLARVFTGLILYQGIAAAETISGKISDINTADQQVTLRRDDTNESVMVHVHDRNSIINLQKGTSLTLDADKDASGAWEAQSADSAMNSHKPNTSATTSSSY